MRIFALLLFLPALVAVLRSETTLLVDAIPSDATFLGSSLMGLPFKDAESTDVKSTEARMSEAIQRLLEVARERGFSYVCLLSVAGEDPIEITIPEVETKLKLRRKNTSITVVFYNEGQPPTPAVAFAPGKVGLGRPQVSMQIDNLAVPPGSAPADWIYINLPRIQSEAAKATAPLVMLEVLGEGPFAEVAVPGMKEPLMVPKGKASLSASWYIDGAAETPLHRKPQDVQSF